LNGGIQQDYATINSLGQTTADNLAVSNGFSVYSEALNFLDGYTLVTPYLSATNGFESDGGLIYSNGVGDFFVESLYVNVDLSLQNMLAQNYYDDQGLRTLITVMSDYQSLSGTTTSARHFYASDGSTVNLDLTTPKVVKVTADLEVFDDTDLSATEKITNGAFATDSNWTKGTGWTIGSGVANHGSNGVGTLSPSTPITITAGKWYYLTFQITEKTASGGLTFTVGGFSTGLIGNVDTYKYRFKATSTANLVITPNVQGLRMKIDNISLKEITGGDLNVVGNLSVNGNVGITRRLSMLNSSSSQCYQNFTGGLLTWTNC
jgi:hypothetical protein